MIKRAILTAIRQDLDKKIVLVSGPRQCGKTTLSKNLLTRFQYLNFDSLKDRKILTAEEWDRTQDLIIFDELHKMKKWKSWIKGIYDTEGSRPRLLVTGSARLNQFKKTGDSLAGRHFNFRLHPFDLKELVLKSRKERENAFETMLNVGGFPEPFLNGRKDFYNRWRASHIDLILRQDLLDLETVRDIKSIEVLIQLLAERVGTSVSTASLANFLQKDPKTVAKWLEILEDLYVIFRVTPYHRNIARAIRKEPKFYFFDTGLVQNGTAAKFENLVACALLKEVQFLKDTGGVEGELHYLKNKEGKEIDFFVYFKEHPHFMIEAKWSDDHLSSSFKAFESHFKGSQKIQIVAELKRQKSTAEGHKILDAIDFLSDLSLIQKL